MKKEQKKNKKMEQALWNPSKGRREYSEITKFTKWLKEKKGLESQDYQGLHAFSVEKAPLFWSSLFEYFHIAYSGEIEPSCLHLDFEKYSWFPHVKLNFAKNLLRHGQSEKTALNFIHESGKQKKISYRSLYRKTAAFQGGLKKILKQGDVLAAYMPNIPETVVSMLGTTALGGIFTSTSCDFGVEGVIDRFGQSRPKVLVTVSRYEYNGKSYDLLPKIREIQRRLDSLEKIIIVDFLGDSPDLSSLEGALSWDEFLSPEGGESVEFRELPFDAPLYIMYSSGTTGKPKCIVHSAGGTLIQHIKELGLHTDYNGDKSIFFFTTCGWMMWNWLISSLYFGGEICLYEGSPSFPSLGEYFEIIEREGVHIFGTSPKFLRALEDSGYEAKSNFSQLETLLSTGAPLLEDQYEFIYKKIKKDICVSSISGGTDILGCFMLGNPALPVYPGELQCIGLGMAVECLSEEGEVLPLGKAGELICSQSFPSRPLYFLNDEEGKKMKSSYFEKFPGLWAHGDYILRTRNGGIKVLGRSDATLNPGGVRIGTAEIYRQIESLSWLEDSLCVGRQKKGDVEIILFVKMAKGEELDERRKKEIKNLIRTKTTPRHVPHEIFSVKDIPYTRSGKKMELAVHKILASVELENTQAVANIESLKEYNQFKKI